LVKQGPLPGPFLISAVSRREKHKLSYHCAKNRLKKFKPTFVPAAGWLTISTVLLVLPGSAFPKEDWTSKIWLDKWVHIGLFGIMTVLWCWALLRIYRDRIKLRRAFLVVALLALFYGISMEFVQLYCVANRSFDTGDIIADGVGCVAGYFFSTGRYIKK
jgi:VanZ family protein